METADTDKTGTASPSGVNMKHQMVHIKTKEECRLGNETIQVWTVELPSKSAEGVFKRLKELIKGIDTIDLQHCRRFAKPKFLPLHVRGPRDYGKEMHSISRAWDSTPQSVMQLPNTSIWDWDRPPKYDRQQARQATLHLLICPTRIVAKDELEQVLLELPPFVSESESWAFPLHVRESTVPLMAPTSPDQANEWSEQYWPIFYRKTNPFGAHPTAIQKAEDELRKPIPSHIDIHHAMSLAEQVSDEVKAAGWGVGTGCVVVERSESGTEIVAVAGDARLKPLPGDAFVNTQIDSADKKDPTCNSKSKTKSKKKSKSKKKAPSSGCDSGNVMGHSVMRAIGIVARKRLQCANSIITSKSAKSEATLRDAGLVRDEAARDAFFLDLPQTDLEREYYKKPNIKPDGYLCLKLELFLTHEPCVMCSMALVHSRVGKVIFKHRMPETGGLTAEVTSNHTGPVGLGYGLCWRKELNWQFMCWEYINPTERGIKTPEEREAELKAQEARLPGHSKHPGRKPFTDRSKSYVNRASEASDCPPMGKLEVEPRVSDFHGTEQGGNGGENANPKTDTKSTTKFSSKNAFNLLNDDGNDLPSDDEANNSPDHASLLNTNTMHMTHSQAYIHADEPSSFTSVNV
ncbi:hypothetical protein K431DRAFT_305968 [Polychaeton citri CBS 116435]|uniref:CMP/dCMP-type deaminase domain-containing protein n=1 Tax=Polychaeton citri CBS 116435 TaxID=1314669 RepID=A0A9P4Q5J6_9PEZI|nr:hypothetical protein K431DRAFT_305968 [Polychaeton citri CBS 116435]